MYVYFSGQYHCKCICLKVMLFCLFIVIIPSLGICHEIARDYQSYENPFQLYHQSPSLANKETLLYYLFNTLFYFYFYARMIFLFPKLYHKMLAEKVTFCYRNDLRKNWRTTAR